jgi:hypothetical protein
VSTESPPPPYGSVHLPTVVSRHPLWDDHDEEYDPDNRRVLDHGRFTFATTWLDGEPEAISRMPQETITPLLLSISLTVVFIALVFKAWWVIVASVLVSLLLTGAWLWPRDPKEAELE